MGTMLLPTAMKVVHWLSEFTEDLEKGKAPALALAGVVGGLLATTALGKLASGVKGVAGNIKTLWEGGEAGAKFLASGTSTLFSGIKSAAGSAASGISSLIGKLSGAAGATEELSGATEEEAIAQGEADAAMDANPIGAIIIAIALLGAGIYEVVKHWKDFKQWGLDAFHFVEHAGEDVFHWFEHNWPYLLGILLGPIALATAIIYKHWDTIKKGAEEAWHFVSHVVAEGWDDVVHDTEHFADEMTAGAEHLWHDLENWWDDGMNDIHDAEVRGFDDVMSLFRSLPGRVLSAVAGFGHLLWNAGADLVHGLISGIESEAGPLISEAEHLADMVESPFKKVLSLFSPSKVFEQHGRDIGAGLILGMHSSIPALEAESRRMALATLSGMSAQQLAGGAGAGAAGALDVTFRFAPTGNTFIDQLFDSLKLEVRHRGGGGIYSAQRAWGQEWPR